MKRLFLLAVTAFVAIAASAQDLPYSKYINFDKKDFKEHHFKYNEKTNTWSVSKVNGWMTAFNVLAVVADGLAVAPFYIRKVILRFCLVSFLIFFLYVLPCLLLSCT